MAIDFIKMEKSRAVKIGVVSSIVSVFPASSLVAFFYRFPVPFVGYSSGFEGALMSLPAVLFYLIIGGVVVVLIGGLSSALVFCRIGGSDDKMKKAIIASTGIINLATATIIANLEKIIGPW